MLGFFKHLQPGTVTGFKKEEKEGGVCGFGREERSFGFSVKKLLDFTLLEPGIVSDLVKGVRLYDVPVMEDCVQQILKWKTMV